MRETTQTDVLIVGSGIAGLTCAIKIAESRPDLRVHVVTKYVRDEGNTRYAAPEGASASQPDLFAQVTQVLHTLSMRAPLLLAN